MEVRAWSEEELSLRLCPVHGIVESVLFRSVDLDVEVEGKVCQMILRFLALVLGFFLSFFSFLFFF